MLLCRMGERNRIRLGDEITHLNSLPLRDLMKEHDEGEIREITAEDEGIAERERQTMGSIMRNRLGSFRATEASKTLWEVIQSDQQSKPWEDQPREAAAGRILKSVLRLVACKKDEQVRLEDGEEESFHLLEGWGAERSPAVVDSTRLQASADERLSNFEGAVRVFLVGGSSPTQGQTMDGTNRRRWGSLRDKLRLRNIACCGSRWSLAESSNLNSTQVVLPAREDDEASWRMEGSSDPAGHGIDLASQQNTAATTSENIDTNTEESCVNTEQPDAPGENTRTERHSIGENTRTERRQLMTFFEDGSNMRVGMNLAAALAAERQLRATQEWENLGSSRTTTAVVVPEVSSPSAGEQVESRRSAFRVSLMSLLEEGDGRQGTASSSLFPEGWDLKEEDGNHNHNHEGGLDPLCCVCMVRRKGAAFIPCGHTFCRLCTRELWVGRGSCPLCNRYIIEILDIF